MENQKLVLRLAMPELLEPSDVSSSDLSDVDKNSSQRSAMPVELTDLPTLVPNRGDPAEYAKEEVSKFWKSDPVSSVNLDNLNEEQLLAVERWARSVNKDLTSSLEKLRTQLQAEWYAKEQVLDQLLQASIGDTELTMK